MIMRGMSRSIFITSETLVLLLNIKIISILKTVYRWLPVIIIASYFILWISLIFIPYKNYGCIKSVLHPHLIKLHVYFQEYGPAYRLRGDSKQVKHYYKNRYPSLNPNQIELKGNLPYDLSVWPAILGTDASVYGKFDGVTDAYKDSESAENCDLVPVFQVEYYDASIFFDILSRYPWKAKIFLVSPIFVMLILYFADMFRRLIRIRC